MLARTMPMSSLLSRIAWLALLVPAAGASDPGFVAHFSLGNLEGFGSSQSSVTNVATGGVAGVGDGYLHVALTFPANLGAQSSQASLVGPHISAGVDGISFWLRDTGAADALQIHVGVGEAMGTVFLSTQGFSPPTDRWERHHVSFTQPGAWTRIKGSGSLIEALESANRLLFRHDVPPLSSMPDDVIGDFGVDRIALTPCAYEVFGTDAGGANALILDTASPALVGAAHVWQVEGIAPAATGFLLLSSARAQLGLFGGTLLVDPSLMLLVPLVSPGSTLNLPLGVPADPILVGLTVDAQVAMRDASQPVGWAFSNGLEATLCE